ncbi:MAG TPA: sugar ABC transporter ATP-binding protein, partial [Alloiococcus sp.]|nr:sugar ABC transporter ATP-binding protein [Alloiococcus sp.]
MHITMSGIKKAFGKNKVLEGVDFDLLPGEVHALMGENGAGKSTLMNILTGLHEKDSGTITIDGQELTYHNPKEAEREGVSFIHQEMITWPELSVIENIFMGKEQSNKLGFLDNKAMKKKANQALEELGVSIPLNKRMGSLSVGQQQLIEIAKTLLNDVKVLIMDEPTAALTDTEIQMLFQIINRLKAEGVSIVYISHRMEEIFQICDRITVMRDGKSIATHNISETNDRQIVKEMVGRDIDNFYPNEDNRTDEVLLEVKNLNNKNIKDISFKLHSGEILGFSGLMGAGRTEIMRAIFGLDPLDSGEIFIEGELVDLKNPHTAISHGVGFLTESRKEEGLILDFSVKDNISMTAFEEFSKKGVIDTKVENQFVDLLIDRLTVKTSSRDLPVRFLSGGNQQKVVMAKWIGAGSRILILDEPTRGV